MVTGYAKLRFVHNDVTFKRGDKYLATGDNDPRVLAGHVSLTPPSDEVKEGFDASKHGQALSNSRLGKNALQTSNPGDLERAHNDVAKARDAQANAEAELAALKEVTPGAQVPAAPVVTTEALVTPVTETVVAPDVTDVNEKPNAEFK